MTKQRELILQILKQSDRHLTADEVFFLAKLKMPTIAMATIYNNLNAMTDAGVITRVHIDGGADCYERETQPHDHLLCEGCGRLSNLRISALPNLLSETLGGEIRGYDLTVRVLCPECKTKRK